MISKNFWTIYKIDLRKGLEIAEKDLRVNEKIRVKSVRVINHENEQLGILSVYDALEKAREVALDLVEVAPTSDPPVCRIMDYGKWKYDQKKKEHKTKQKQHVVTLKELRLRPKIDKHDRQVKVDRARKFLDKGSKVQFTMLFRGREMAHMEIAENIFEGIVSELKDVGKVEAFPKRQGRRMTMILASTKF